MNKNEIISKVYHDPAGFGSNAATLAYAKKYDNTVTLEDVKDWKAKNIEQTKQFTFIRAVPCSGLHHMAKPFQKH